MEPPQLTNDLSSFLCRLRPSAPQVVSLQGTKERGGTRTDRRTRKGRKKRGHPSPRLSCSSQRRFMRVGRSAFLFRKDSSSLIARLPFTFIIKPVLERASDGRDGRATKHYFISRFLLRSTFIYDVL